MSILDGNCAEGSLFFYNLWGFFAFLFVDLSQSGLELESGHRRMLTVFYDMLVGVEIDT